MDQLQGVDVKVLLALMVQFEVWDGLITSFFVSRGLAREGNPLMANLVEDGSFLWVKIAGALLCIPALWLLYKRFPKLGISAAAVVVMFYVAVVGWNFKTVLAG
jgi:hypothetical protein